MGIWKGVRFVTTRGAVLALLASGVVLAVACSSENEAASGSDDAGVAVEGGSASDAGLEAMVTKQPFPDAPACAGDAGLYDTSATDGGLPGRLSQTGLYANIGSKTLAPNVKPFTPSYVLWSDGAAKRRWISLPEGCQIDTSNMDHWNFPVGTRFWKEFSVGGKAIETRLIVRTGPKSDDFEFMSYAWRNNGSEADAVPDGVVNALGTTHDIPPVAHCLTCHGHVPEHVLGFGAIELSKSQGLNLESLVEDGRLSVPPAEPVAVPGDEVTQKALGYLHANCGNCHNDDGIPFQAPLSMRLSVKNKTPEETDVYRTALEQPVDRWCGVGVNMRLSPGLASQSCLVVRPSTRSIDMIGQMQMPPVGSKLRDDGGLASLEAWINSLPK